MGQIQRISLKDRARVGDVVRRSLESDPCVRYIARKGQVPQVFDGLMCPYWSSQPRELHLMTEGCKSVVVAHFHPSEEVSAFSTFLRDLRVALHVRLFKLIASIRTGSKIEKGKEQFAREAGPYIYVYMMGTLPEYQNRGLGSALLSHISAIADSRGLPCYLEVVAGMVMRVHILAQLRRLPQKGFLSSSSEGSRRLYKRHGYTVRETLYMDKGSPPLYLMSRPARPSTEREVARRQ